MTDERAKEVVARLRELAVFEDVPADDMNAAADELERLRDALKPFAAIAEEWSNRPVTGVMVPTHLLKRAAEVLK